MSAILFLLQLSIFILHFLPDPDPLVLDSNTLKKIEAFESQLKNKEKKAIRTYSSTYFKSEKISKADIHLFPFNPNTISKEEWRNLGFSEKQSLSILKWKEKAGKFHSKEELAKVFVISPQKYSQMEPYIKIPEQDKMENIKTVYSDSLYAKKKKVYPLLEINSASDSELNNLPLIGDGRVRSIVRYRDYLGGFVSLDQLKEVRSLPDSVIQIILPRLIVDPSKIRMININSDSLIHIRHPYLSKQILGIIASYRKEHGDYKNVEEIKHLPLVDESVFSKIRSYLEVR